MSYINKVPIIDIHKDNFKDLWPSLILSIKSACFVAMDLEMSGLGLRKLLMQKSIEDRYQAIVEIAKSRAIVSLGISTFKLEERESTGESEENDPKANKVTKGTKFTYFVQTYNIWTLCSEKYIVEPEALKFLIEHGFDFNKQYCLGIPYTKGTADESLENPFTQSLRGLFLELAVSKKLLVLHNGMVDLAFLYHSFYAEIPATLPQFIADVSEIFGDRIYDTKYISEFVARTPASFLEYLFRKLQRDNSLYSIGGKSYISIRFPNYQGNMNCHIINHSLHLVKDAGSEVCPSFSAYGFCNNRDTCTLSHNVENILDLEVRKSKGKIKKKRKLLAGKKLDSKVEDMDSIDNVIESSDSKGSSEESLGGGNAVSNGHRAGSDAFMTGFVFASFVAQHGKFPTDHTMFCPKTTQTQDMVNKVYLSGKTVPLTIMKSNFTKTSKQHQAKWELVNKSISQSAMF